ncbi:YceI family protein [Vulgatibacter sp.]|uniref:YceI family protein n=1 Tax=Vulgatibacter sp. TaxID=1971226 RepID=UPI003562C805
MRRTFATSLTALSLATLGATACAKDPTAGKTEAAVAEAKQVEAAPAAAQRLVITPAESKIGFVGAKVTAQHVGEFRDFEGKIALVDGKLEGGQIEFAVKPASVLVDGGLPKLEGHLVSPDFFDAAKYPEARFVSTEIKPGSETAGMTHTVTGNLEIRGTRRSVTFPALVEMANDMVRAKTEFGINRKDFGIQYPGMPDDLIKDNVLIRVDLKAPRAN